jgi:hypothetical protein
MTSEEQLGLGRSIVIRPGLGSQLQLRSAGKHLLPSAFGDRKCRKPRNDYVIARRHSRGLGVHIIEGSPLSSEVRFCSRGYIRPIK